ncbi:MAG: ATPase, partial [Boseongicola sp.]
DSVYIASNITFENLAPLSTYLGKPGNPKLGGLPWDEYCRRQDLHRMAEVAAMHDTSHFAARAKDIYGYENFVCDSSGSICEVVDPDDPEDPVMSALSKVLLPVWIKGSEDHTKQLIRRFDRAPKPMCYQPDFLQRTWQEFQSETGTTEADIDPDEFVRWAYARALAHRQPRYMAMAERWGTTLAADDVARVKSEGDMIELIGRALEARG